MSMILILINDTEGHHAVVPMLLVVLYCRHDLRFVDRLETLKIFYMTLGDAQFTGVVKRVQC